MWQLTVVCSDEKCGEVFELQLEDLDDFELAVCKCGHSVVLLAVASFEPLYAVA